MVSPRTVNAYENSRTLGWTRIDLILAVYEGMMKKLTHARAALAEGDADGAKTNLAKVQIGVDTLIAGVDLVEGELSANFRRLYDFVLHCLKEPARIDDAMQVLRALHEAFMTIRNDALELERKGAIPPAEQMKFVQASA